jgi:hypothetical protein
MVSFFTENAYVNIWRHGKRRARKEINKLFPEHISKVNAGKGKDAHFTVMPVITVDGDHAKGHWMLYIFIADPIRVLFPGFSRADMIVSIPEKMGNGNLVNWSGPIPSL